MFLSHVALSVYLSMLVSLPECASQFSCGDGTCVSLTQRCDSFPDCADERDELNCPCKYSNILNNIKS